VTEVGTLAAPELLEERETEIPEAGAALVSVAVPEAD